MSRLTGRNIYLTGFMGSGKTTVGRLLSQSLGLTFIDLDQTIVESSGISIPEIFKSCGEGAFRSMESENLKKAAGMRGCVVSTGGGVVLAAGNRDLMRQTGIIVNLVVPLEEILLRTGNDQERPLLAREPADIDRMMAEREPWYADADIRIDTGGKKAEDVAEEILMWIEAQRDE